MIQFDEFVLYLLRLSTSLLFTDKLISKLSKKSISAIDVNQRQPQSTAIRMLVEDTHRFPRFRTAKNNNFWQPKP